MADDTNTRPPEQTPAPASATTPVVPAPVTPPAKPAAATAAPAVPSNRCPHCAGELVPHREWYHCNRCGCRLDKQENGSFTTRQDGHPTCTLMLPVEQLTTQQQAEYARLKAMAKAAG